MPKTRGQLYHRVRLLSAHSVHVKVLNSKLDFWQMNVHVSLAPSIRSQVHTIHHFMFPHTKHVPTQTTVTSYSGATLPSLFAATSLASAKGGARRKPIQRRLWARNGVYGLSCTVPLCSSRRRWPFNNVMRAVVSRSLAVRYDHDDEVEEREGSGSERAGGRVEDRPPYSRPLQHPAARRVRQRSATNATRLLQLRTKPLG